MFLLFRFTFYFLICIITTFVHTWTFFRRNVLIQQAHVIEQLCLNFLVFLLLICCFKDNNPIKKKQWISFVSISYERYKVDHLVTCCIFCVSKTYDAIPCIGWIKYCLISNNITFNYLQSDLLQDAWRISLWSCF